jgi:hypothetical protein
VFNKQFSFKNRRIMKKLMILMFLVSAGLLAQDRIEKNLGDFNELKTYRGLQVELIQSDSPKVIIEGTKASSVTVKNINGVLKISMKIENTFSSDEVMTYLYYSQPISLIHANEGSNVFSDKEITQDRLEVVAQEGARVKLDLDVKEVEVSAATGGYVNLKGTAVSQKVRANTGGIYKGADLATADTRVSAATGGNAVVKATNSVDAKANTAGIISIKGDPEKVTVKESTGGNINN